MKQIALVLTFVTIAISVPSAGAQEPDNPKNLIGKTVVATSKEEVKFLFEQGDGSLRFTTFHDPAPPLGGNEIVTTSYNLVATDGTTLTIHMDWGGGTNRQINAIRLPPPRRDKEEAAKGAYEKTYLLPVKEGGFIKFTYSNKERGFLALKIHFADAIEGDSR